MSSTCSQAILISGAAGGLGQGEADRRRWLYTAITRAKEIVVLVGSSKAIAMAVKNDTVSKRFTALAERLRGEL